MHRSVLILKKKFNRRSLAALLILILLVVQQLLFVPASCPLRPIPSARLSGSETASLLLRAAAPTAAFPTR